MTLRNPPRYGAVSMYRLIASVVAGEPVLQGDASLAGPHGRRDARLAQYAGAQHRTVTIEQLHEERRNANPEDQPADAQQPPEERPSPEGGS